MSSFRPSKLQVSLNGLVLYGYHGVLEAEKEMGQRFVIDIGLTLRPSVDIDADDLNQVVNYASVFETVKATFHREPIKLIETCAYRIGRDVLDAFERIDAVEVTVKKPSVPVACQCDHFAATVQLER